MTTTTITSRDCSQQLQTAFKALEIVSGELNALEVDAKRLCDPPTIFLRDLLLKAAIISLSEKKRFFEDLSSAIHALNPDKITSRIRKLGIRVLSRIERVQKQMKNVSRLIENQKALILDHKLSLIPSLFEPPARFPKLTCFTPGKWHVDSSGPKFSNENRPMWIEDLTSKKKYLNFSDSNIRAKCLALAFGAFTVSLLAMIVKVLAPDESFTDGAKALILMPFMILALFFAALYGIVSPQNGRKLYNEVESSYFDQWRLAPCFNPEATKHLFGSDIKKTDGW